MRVSKFNKKSRMSRDERRGVVFYFLISTKLKETGCFASFLPFAEDFKFKNSGLYFPLAQ